MATMSKKQISTVGKNIKKFRANKGLSQDKLSKNAGVAYNTVIKIESGVIQNPTVNTASKIAKALGVSVDVLLGK
jgi:transcriptional regulator with XRE-family HTH domain